MTAALRGAGWLVALSLLACACLWSATDRLARQGVLLQLPAAFLTGGNALAARAAEALRRNDPANAERLSRAALKRQPVDAPALRVAGLAAIGVGDAPRGDALMRLAGAAGWRDVPTQLYWAEAALASGALDVAMERLDAVARTGTQRAQTRPLMLSLEATSRGRAALLRRLALPNIWVAGYLPDIAQLDDAAMAARVMLVANAKASAVTLDPMLIDGLGWSLVRRGRADLAWQLTDRKAGSWLAPFRADAALQAGPFEWLWAAASGLDVTVAPRKDGPALHIAATGPALLTVASQLTRLPIGEARLTAAVDGAKTSLPLIVLLDCMAGSGASAVSEATVTGRLAVRLRVPAGCSTQRLTLAVTGEEAARGADLWVSAPKVVPLAARVP